MASPLPLFLAVSGAGAWVYKNGVPEVIKNFADHKGPSSKRDGSDNGGSSQASHHSEHYAGQAQAQAQQPQQIIVMPEPSGRANRSWLFWSSSAVVALAAYYYYIHNHGTKKVISRVEETATETQDLVCQFIFYIFLFFFFNA